MLDQLCDENVTKKDPLSRPIAPTDTSGSFILFVMMNLLEGKLVIDPVLPSIVAPHFVNVITSNIDSEPKRLPIVGRSTIHSAESILEK